jgi:hypothetical protein
MRTRIAWVVVPLVIALGCPASALELCVSLDHRTGGVKEGAPVRLRSACKTRKDGTAKEVSIDTTDALEAALVSNGAQRVVRGSVLADGRIERGTGFDVTEASPGRCRLDFTPPFSDFPTAVVSPICVGCSASEISGPLDGSSIFFGFADAFGSVTLFAFHFIVMGPR